MESNFTSNINGTSDESIQSRTIHNVCATLIVGMGLPGNLLTFLVIMKTRLYQQVGMIFVLNLLVSHILQCLFCLPYILVLSFIATSSFSQTMDMNLCRFLGYLTYSIAGSEIMGLIFISLNRYILVVHYHVYDRIFNKRRNIALMLAFGWLIYFLLFLLPLVEIWGEFKYDTERFSCHAFNDSDTFGKFIVVFTLALAVPTMGFCYVAIIYKVLTSRRKVGVNTTKPETSASNGQNVSKLNNRGKAEIQLVLMVILILTTFTVAYFPFLILNILDPRRLKYGVNANVAFVYLAWSHLVINPIVYSAMNPHIRKAFGSYCASV